MTKGTAGTETGRQEGLGNCPVRLQMVGGGDPARLSSPLEEIPQ